MEKKKWLFAIGIVIEVKLIVISHVFRWEMSVASWKYVWLVQWDSVLAKYVSQTQSKVVDFKNMIRVDHKNKPVEGNLII